MERSVGSALRLTQPHAGYTAACLLGRPPGGRLINQFFAMVVHFWLFAVDGGRTTPAGGPVAVRRAQGPGRVFASRLRSVGENMGNPGIGALFGRERPHLPCAFIRRHNLCHIGRAYSLLEGSRGSLSGPAWITGRAGGGCRDWLPGVRTRGSRSVRLCV